MDSIIAENIRIDPLIFSCPSGKRNDEKGHLKLKPDNCIKQGRYLSHKVDVTWRTGRRVSEALK